MQLHSVPLYVRARATCAGHVRWRDPWRPGSVLLARCLKGSVLLARAPKGAAPSVARAPRTDRVPGREYDDDDDESAAGHKGKPSCPGSGW